MGDKTPATADDNAKKLPAHLRDDLKFKPGQVANPAGRPKGARSKLGTAFLESMLSDFEKHGETVIAQVRETKPDQYLKVVASILPKEIEAGEETLNALSEILTRIDGRTRTIRPAIEETLQ